MRHVLQVGLGLGCALCVAALLPAQGKLSYRTVSNNKESKTKTLSVGSGKSKNVSWKSARRLRNTGHNDLILHTKGMFGTKPKFRLIKNGSSTIAIPPIVADLEVTKVQCLTYATVQDTKSLLAQLGDSASKMASSAASKSTSAVQSAQTAALRVFDPADSLKLLNAISTKINQMQTTLDARLKEQAGKAAQALSLQKDFPALHAAVGSTANLRFDPGRLSQRAQSATAKLLADIAAFDAKYGISSTVGESVERAVDMARDFPEVLALQKVDCDMDPSWVFSVSGDLGAMEMELVGLRLGIGSKNAGAALGFGLDGAAGGAAQSHPCADGFRTALEKDRAALKQHLRKTQTLLATATQRNARELGRSARAASALLTQTTALLRKVDALGTAVLRAQQAEQSFLSTSRSPFAKWYELDGKDLTPKRVHTWLERHSRAAQAYGRALRQRVAPWTDLARSVTAWNAQASNLARSLGRARGLGALTAHLRKLPEFAPPPETTKHLHTSVNDHAKRTATAVAELARTTPAKISGQLIRQLNSLGRAIAELRTAWSSVLTRTGELLRATARLRAAAEYVGISCQHSGALYSRDPEAAAAWIERGVAETRKAQSEIPRAITRLAQAVGSTTIAITGVTEQLGLFSKGGRVESTSAIKAANDLTGALTAIPGRLAALQACATTHAQQGDKVANSTPQRFTAFLSGAGAAAAAGVSATAAAAIEAARTAAKAAQTAAGTLRSKSNTATSALRRFLSAQKALVGGLVPVPQPNAQALLQNFEREFARLNRSASSLAIAATDCRAKLAVVDARMRELAAAARQQKNRAGTALGQVQWPRVNVGSVYTQAQSVDRAFLRWADTSADFAKSVIEGVRGKVDDTIDKLIKRLADAKNRVPGVQGARTAAVNAYNTLASSKRRTDAINKVKKALENSAGKVHGDLQKLLSPKNLGSFKNVSKTISSGKKVAAKVASFTTDAVNEFKSATAAMASDLQEKTGAFITAQRQVMDTLNAIQKEIPHAAGTALKIQRKPASKKKSTTKRKPTSKGKATKKGKPPTKRKR